MDKYIKISSENKMIKVVGVIALRMIHPFSGSGSPLSNLPAKAFRLDRNKDPHKSRFLSLGGLISFKARKAPRFLKSVMRPPSFRALVFETPNPMVASYASSEAGLLQPLGHFGRQASWPHLLSTQHLESSRLCLGPLRRYPGRQRRLGRAHPPVPKSL